MTCLHTIWILLKFLKVPVILALVGPNASLIIVSPFMGNLCSCLKIWKCVSLPYTPNSSIILFWCLASNRISYCFVLNNNIKYACWFRCPGFSVVTNKIYFTPWKSDRIVSEKYKFKLLWRNISCCEIYSGHISLQLKWEVNVSHIIWTVNE